MVRRTEKQLIETERAGAERAVTIDELKDILEGGVANEIMAGDDHRGKRFIAYCKKHLKLGNIPTRKYIQKEAGIPPQKITAMITKLGISNLEKE